MIEIVLALIVGVAGVPGEVPATPRPAPLPDPARSDVYASIAFAQTKPGAATAAGAYVVTFRGLGSFRVDPAKVHVDRVALDATVERRDVGIAGESYDVASGPGPRVVRAVRVTVPRSAMRPGMQHMELRLDPGVATRDGVPRRAHIWDTFPYQSALSVYVSERADLDVLRRFAGRDVTTYGRIALSCTAPNRTGRTLDTSPHARVRIFAVGRDAAAARVLQPGSAAFAANQMRYEAVDPLRVKLDASQLPAEIGQCSHPELHVAGRWDFERSAGTERPSRVLPDRVEIGMTHADVAHILGYPPSTLAKEYYDGSSLWQYADGRASFWWTSVRFAGDRVTSVFDPSATSQPIGSRNRARR